MAWNKNPAPIHQVRSRKVAGCGFFVTSDLAVRGPCPWLWPAVRGGIQMNSARAYTRARNRALLGCARLVNAWQGRIVLVR